MQILNGSKTLIPSQELLLYRKKNYENYKQLFQPGIATQMDYLKKVIFLKFEDKILTDHISISNW